jgi:uncharacterized membrane protein YkvA (DUF1232 family)
VPWYAKALAALVAAYAFSPLDLVPDFIPVLGYVDDLILVPLGVLAVRAMIPRDVLEECRQRAADVPPTRLMSRAGLVIVAGIWVVLTLVGVWVFVRFSWPWS